MNRTAGATSNEGPAPRNHALTRLKRLDAAGLVTRTRDPADERRVRVDLTRRGRALEAELRGITDKIKSACQLTDQGLDKLRRTLEALAHPAVEQPPQDD